MRKLMQALGAGLAVAALTITGATAQDDYASHTRSYLEAGMAPHASLGYRADRTIPDMLQPLTIEGGYLWSVYLRAGENYRVYAACDNDCSDVDMELYGVDGMLVDRDIGTDDTPYVQITPDTTGRHFVRLWVFQCAQEPCYVAARVVAGGTPAPRVEDGPIAEGGYEEVVRSELDAAGAAHLAAGYSPFGQDVVTPITLDSDHRQTVALQSGRSYIFQGACDQDCSDVDLEVLDANGQRVVADEATDDRPVVQVTPPRGGNYTVRVWLAQCGQEPCFVGVRGFVR